MSILQTIDLKKYYGTEPNITRALRKVFVFENFPKPMQLVVTAVVAFGGAAVIKLVLVYFFGL